jgi:hypothetical protein
MTFSGLFNNTLLPQDKLFGRRVSANIDGTAYEGLRTAFKVEKWIQGKPNNAEITIWNLSTESRKKLQGAGLSVYLKAGYQSNFAQIFFGQSRTISHVKEKADWVTKITAGDGETAIRTSRAVISYGKNTPILTIIKGIAAKTGLDLGNIETAVKALPGNQTQSPNGTSDSGPAYNMLQKYLDTLGYLVSVQDGALQVMPHAQANVPLVTSQTTAVPLSQTSGMIGSPEICEKGTDKKQVLKVKSLVQPKFFPGCLVIVDSVNIKGQFRVEKVTHHGDLYETKFYSELELKAVNS